MIKLKSKLVRESKSEEDNNENKDNENKDTDEDKTKDSIKEKLEEAISIYNQTTSRHDSI